MRRSSGARWSSWCVPGVIRPIWLANSSLRPRRSAIGWPSRTGRDGRREVEPVADAGLSVAEREELSRLRRENKQLRLERDILSRSDGLVRPRDRRDPVRLFRFMSANQARFPIAAMARVLGVSKAGYYAWRHRPPAAHAQIG